MPCPPGYCASAMDCGDKNCPGHVSSAIYRAFLDNDIPTPEEAMSWTEWALIALIAGSVAIIVGWAGFDNWPLLSAVMR